MELGLVEGFGIAGLAFLLKKIIDFSRQLRGGDIDGALTQLVAWGGGIGLFWLAASSMAFAKVDIAGFLFSDLDWASKVLGGLLLGSGASFISDRNTANDDTQSAELPRLFALNKKVAKLASKAARSKKGS